MHKTAGETKDFIGEFLPLVRDSRDVDIAHSAALYVSPGCVGTAEGYSRPSLHFGTSSPRTRALMRVRFAAHADGPRLCIRHHRPSPRGCRYFRETDEHRQQEDRSVSQARPPGHPLHR
ncbi:MAG: hypothetical protein MZU91_05080 [Desulfosudis oleivorans]|nr:hypothetical protein [Desulfosudis oleivorans]